MNNSICYIWACKISLSILDPVCIRCCFRKQFEAGSSTCSFFLLKEYIWPFLVHDEVCKVWELVAWWCCNMTPACRGRHSCLLGLMLFFSLSLTPHTKPYFNKLLHYLFPSNSTLSHGQSIVENSPI